MSDAAHARSKKPSIAPKVILIEINTEKNRTTYLQQKGDTQKLAWLREASEGATRAMINDFNDFFNFCPVYYFYDTNLQDVINKNYSVLMDADRKPLGSNIKISDTDEIKIAYFGYPNTDKHVVPEGVAEDPDSPEARVYDKTYGTGNYPSNSKALEAGLVVTDKDFKETKTDRRFYVGRNRSLNAFRNHRYSYSSPHFSIQYVRSAEELDRLLTEHYRGILHGKN
ncbi:hypothetical protein ACTHGU_03420 [Chitinophagaceae bacterium MMS25-I14]